MEDALSLGIPGFELLPDGSFHPDEPVTRAGYARVSEGVLTLLTVDPSLPTLCGRNIPLSRRSL